MRKNGLLVLYIAIATFFIISTQLLHALWGNGPSLFLQRATALFFTAGPAAMGFVFRGERRILALLGAAFAIGLPFLFYLLCSRLWLGLPPLSLVQGLLATLLIFCSVSLAVRLSPQKAANAPQGH